MATGGAGHPLPGIVATAFIILTTTLWTFWGVAEMFYEGWWGTWANRLPYLVPGAVCLILSLMVLTWPRPGGWLIIAVGAGFTAWWFTLAASRGGLTWRGALGMFPVSGLLILTGVLFLYEARYRRGLRLRGRTPPKRWLQRNLRYVGASGVPLLVAAAVTAYWLPILLARVDDGDRGARLIEGNGVTLIWAPEGPGWSEGGYDPQDNLSWNDIARYGVASSASDGAPALQGGNASTLDMKTTGLCRYLSPDGRTLMPEPQDVWRMPTTDEIVRSLVRHGKNAGCTWDGVSDRAACDKTPDKETPLWAPDRSPIYYWSADEYNDRNAYYVSYNGRIGDQPKSWGNARHGFRCVREPDIVSQALNIVARPRQAVD